jgi:hypothetical protein
MHRESRWTPAQVIGTVAVLFALLAGSSFLSATSTALADDSGSDHLIPLTSVEPGQAARAATVQLNAANPNDLQNQTIAVFMEACVPRSSPNDNGCDNSTQKQVPCVRPKAGDGSCGAIIPFDLPIGTYEVRLYKTPPVSTSSLGTSPFVPLRVVRETSEGPTLLGVNPEVAYPADNTNGCTEASANGSSQPAQSANLILSGDNFSLAGKDNRILVNNNELKVCWNCGDLKPCGKCDIVGTVDQNGREIRLTGIPIAAYGGIVKLAVNVGMQSSTEKTVTISRVNSSTPRWWALAFVVVIIVILGLILSRPAQKKIAGQSYKLMTALMLDAETDTYSLSKFQFYLWTFAVVLGYSYLTLVRSLIQGTFEFSDVPGNLPGILGLSVGTSVVATGITSAVGSKGAGSVQPGWADLLTVGGVVVPERVQFGVWTIVGVVAFLSLTFLADPGSLQNLPAVPQGFLLLMGASSAGYLGGKMVRKPGPVIMAAKALWELESVAPPAAGRSDRLTVSIIGQSLATDCGIRFGELKVPYVKGPAPGATDNVVEMVTRDDRATDDNLASELRLTMRDKDLIDKIVAMQEPRPTAPVAGGAGAAGASAVAPLPEPTKKPQLSVTNPDGQMAAWPVVIVTK